MASLKSSLPDVEVLLALEPEELAGYLLEHLNSLAEREQEQLNRDSFHQRDKVKEYEPKYQDEIRRALMEAWVWLEREGLLAPKPGSTGDWFFITRAGKKLKSRTDLKAFRNANLLPRKLLHPVISQKVTAPFIRGDYDVAVFQAFKEVEVAVRAAGEFSPQDLGVDLMRKAFRPQSGPLTNTLLPVPEQEALMHLFAGSIGYYKNPGSHRHVLMASADEAVEVICLASRLMKIVESSKSKTP